MRYSDDVEGVERLRKRTTNCRNSPTPSERPLTAHSLVQNAGPLWDEATRTPFLEALAAGTLPVEAFRRWLAQDYLFAKDLMAFQSILLAKAPRDCHKALVGGLGALDKELEWFESHAGRLQVDLAIPPHRTCRRYTDFLLRCAYTEAYPVLIAMLFGVEASYLAAWSALVPAGRLRGVHRTLVERGFCGVRGGAGRAC